MRRRKVENDRVRHSALGRHRFQELDDRRDASGRSTETDHRRHLIAAHRDRVVELIVGVVANGVGDDRRKLLPFGAFARVVFHRTP